MVVGRTSCQHIRCWFVKVKQFQPMIKVIGPIMEGDLIVTSTVPGVGMKMKDYIPGTVIGKALETKDSLDIGKVEMLIMVI